MGKSCECEKKENWTVESAEEGASSLRVHCGICGGLSDTYPETKASDAVRAEFSREGVAKW